MATVVAVKGLERQRQCNSEQRQRGALFLCALNTRAGNQTRQHDKAQTEQPWRAPSFLATRMLQAGRAQARGYGGGEEEEDGVAMVLRCCDVAMLRCCGVDSTFVVPSEGDQRNHETTTGAKLVCACRIAEPQY